MDFKNFQMTFQEALRKRNFAYTLCAILGISNILLCGLLSRHEDRWLLFPFPDGDRLEVTPSKFSDDYLQAMADRITTRLLTMSPETIEQRLQEFAGLTIHSGALRKKLEQHTHKIKEERVSTVFYPKDFHIEREKKKIHVSGDFYTFFGTDRVPVIQKQTIVLSYGRGINGIFILKDFDMKEGDA